MSKKLAVAAAALFALFFGALLGTPAIRAAAPALEIQALNAFNAAIQQLLTLAKAPIVCQFASGSTTACATAANPSGVDTGGAEQIGLWVFKRPDIQGNGSLATVSGTAFGPGTTIPLTGVALQGNINSLRMHITGVSGTGVSLQGESTVGADTAYGGPLTAIPLGGGAEVTAITADGWYLFTTANASNFRLNATAAGTSTATIFYFYQGGAAPTKVGTTVVNGASNPVNVKVLNANPNGPDKAANGSPIAFPTVGTDPGGSAFTKSLQNTPDVSNTVTGAGNATGIAFGNTTPFDGGLATITTTVTGTTSGIVLQPQTSLDGTAWTNATAYAGAASCGSLASGMGTCKAATVTADGTYSFRIDGRRFFRYLETTAGASGTVSVAYQATTAASHGAFDIPTLPAGSQTGQGALAPAVSPIGKKVVTHVALAANTLFTQPANPTRIGLTIQCFGGTSGTPAPVVIDETGAAITAVPTAAQTTAAQGTVELPQAGTPAPYIPAVPTLSAVTLYSGTAQACNLTEDNR